MSASRIGAAQLLQLTSSFPDARSRSVLKLTPRTFSDGDLLARFHQNTTSRPPAHSDSKEHKPNIVVVGGSYAGGKAAEYLAAAMHESHRVLLLEKNSHFQHLFTFPRFAVVPGHEHMAFIPFVPMSFLDPLSTFSRSTEGPIPTFLQGVSRPTPAHALALLRGTAAGILPDRVIFDAAEVGDRQALREIPFDYLVLATGTRLPPPGTLDAGPADKQSSVAALQKMQADIAGAEDITVIGGGAVGVQMATDIKDRYPSKNVRLVHSREHLMHAFHPALHAVLATRAAELGIELILGDRATVPAGGYPVGAGPVDVALASGRTFKTQLAILCTGQHPLSAPLALLAPSALTAAGYVRVQPTLQIAPADARDGAFPRVFAIGDVADSGGQRSARAAFAQALVVAENVARLHQHRVGTGGEGGHGPALATYAPQPAGIHMSLGMTRSVRFRNPALGDTEPLVRMADDGRADLGVMRVWKMRAPGVTAYLD